MRFSELEGASVGVWGAGREIGSFARQLARRLPAARIDIAAFDTPPGFDVGELLDAPSVRVVNASAAVAALRGCDVLVRSPGVSIHRPELVELRAAGLAITTATSLWLAEHGGAGVIGVTGTKGKSTTSALLAHLARAAGLPMHLAGNIGVPALDLLDADASDPVTLGFSSYQIADLQTGPAVAVVTNLFREHLDWHLSEQAYRAEKLRLLSLPGVSRRVLSAREPLLPAALRVGERAIYFGSEEGWDARGGWILHAGERVTELAELPLRGEHNALNLCAALTALEAFGTPPPALPQGLAGFAALPHRLEPVAERDGVAWVNDSISTTPESALAALASFPEDEVILIAGGQDRGQDYASLARVLAARDLRLIAVPSTGARLLSAAAGAGLRGERAHAAESLEEAVALARALAHAGDIVLLSPAAPSYDHHRDFEQRGERFSALAKAPS